LKKKSPKKTKTLWGKKYKIQKARKSPKKAPPPKKEVSFTAGTKEPNEPPPNPTPPGLSSIAEEESRME
jgi:hypothetical protein